MATCYLCATNEDPTDEPAAIACCVECGMFFCRWDGARHHGTADFYCAVCLVPILLSGAGIDLGDEDPPDGGGPGALAAAVRAELHVEDFERFCADMWDASSEPRLKWRKLLGSLSPDEAAAEVSERIGEFAGGRELLERAYRNAPTVDAEGVAAAAGVAETAARAEIDGSGPLNLPGSRAVSTEDLPKRKEVDKRVAEVEKQKVTLPQTPKLQTRTLGGSS